jgi:hypothetical protein
MRVSQDIHIINETGAEIEGTIIFRSESDIKVKIIQPFKGLSWGLHIPYFARPVRSYTTTCGESTAKRLLVNLYELGGYIAENREYLISQLHVYFQDDDFADLECQNEYFENCFLTIVPINTRDEVLKLLTINSLS